jgi:sec-independent protein translocase protein TatA
MVNTLLFLNFLGTGEFVLIAFVFLLLFGPDKIPGIARSVGQGIRKVKDASNDIKKEINESSQGVDTVTSEMKNDLKEIENLTQSVKRGVKKTLDTK